MMTIVRSLCRHVWGFFCEGQPESMMRLVLLLGCGLILGTWTYLCLRTHQFIDFPGGVVLVLGLLITGKVAQRWQEKQECDAEPPSGPGPRGRDDTAGSGR